MNLFPYTDDNRINFYHTIAPGSRVIYLLILFLVITALASLPFIRMEVGVNSAGFIRPATERIEIKAAVAGYLDSLLVAQGGSVKCGEPIARFRDSSLLSRLHLLQWELQRISLLKSDLHKILSAKHISANRPVHLQTSEYLMELNNLMSRESRYGLMLEKVETELTIAEKLARESIIAPKELYDKKIEKQVLLSELNTLFTGQRAKWTSDLQTITTRKAELEDELQRLKEDRQNLTLHSPVDGVVQVLHAPYAKTYWQAGEPICLITPNASLIVETYISTKDAGLLQVGQSCIVKIDAFNYQYFGILTGEIESIDGDFTIVDGAPTYRVRCKLHNSKLKLKNGFVAMPSKGMSVQVRFLVAERTAWQLLYDNVNDWLNPSSL